MKKRLIDFDTWLDNEFWYHNKWYWLIGVMLAVFIVLTAVNNIGNIEYDWEIAYIYSPLHSAPGSVSGIESTLSEVLDDRNEDGKTHINFVNFQDAGYANGEIPTLRAFNDWQYLIAVLDKSSYEKYEPLGYFAGEPRLIDGLYYTACEGTPTQFDIETASAAGYDAQELAELNAKLKDEYKIRLQQAIDIVSRLK
ncbi:MAG: hypothetical protein LBN97_00150 [Oscillospiraceae bacterium]|jgi:hypothetical protein|nr:hypothetical protein [Oscillospiraceae bacterium]